MGRQEAPEQDGVRPQETVLFGPVGAPGSFSQPLAWALSAAPGAAAGPPPARSGTAARRCPPGRLCSLRVAHWDRGEGGFSRESRVLHGTRSVPCPGCVAAGARTVVRLTPRAPVGSCQLPAGARAKEPSPGGWTPQKPVTSRARRPQSGTEVGAAAALWRLKGRLLPASSLPVPQGALGRPELVPGAVPWPSPGVWAGLRPSGRLKDSGAQAGILSRLVSFRCNLIAAAGACF